MVSLVGLWTWFDSGESPPRLDEVPWGEVSPTPLKESGASRCPVRPFLDRWLLLHFTFDAENLNMGRPGCMFYGTGYCCLVHVSCAPQGEIFVLAYFGDFHCVAWCGSHFLALHLSDFLVIHDSSMIPMWFGENAINAMRLLPGLLCCDGMRRPLIYDGRSSHSLHRASEILSTRSPSPPSP